MIESMSPLVAVAAGIGLAASAGFRVFVPLLAASLAVREGLLTVGESFQWLGSDAALIFFGVATVAEIGAYFIPWVDNLLDTAATPLAVLAGTVLATAVLPGESDWTKWLGGLVLGGGPASLFQGATVLARGASTGTTGGLGNPVFAFAESGTSVALAVITVVLPLVAGAVVLLLLFWFGSRVWKWRRRPRLSPDLPEDPAP